VRARGLKGLPRLLALAAVLIVVQATAAAHLGLDDSHPAGETCALCVGAGVLGAANVGASFELGGITRAPAEFHPAPVPNLVRRIGHGLIRGPPQAS